MNKEKEIKAVLSAHAEIDRLRLENEGLRLVEKRLTQTIDELVNRVMELRQQIPDLAAIVGDSEPGDQT